MNNKKFCKFCGKEINKDNIVCPKCGRQLEKVEKKKIVVEDKEVEQKTKNPFYTEVWFMWVMLVLFAPVGIFFMWKFHPTMKKNTKIIISVIFGILFLVSLGSGATSETSDNKTNSEASTKQTKVSIIDFSTIERNAINEWCKNNKVVCKVSDDYSDTVEKGQLISQSVKPDDKVDENSTVNIIYSLGKKPPIEYQNALKKAESYSKIMHMSKNGIYEQLTSEYGENFEADAAQYAIDNIKADWNANALAKAKSYQETMNMSKNAIYDQLISEYGEKFTAEEAQYAIDHLEE